MGFRVCFRVPSFLLRPYFTLRLRSGALVAWPKRLSTSGLWSFVCPEAGIAATGQALQAVDFGWREPLPEAPTASHAEMR